MLHIFITYGYTNRFQTKTHYHTGNNQIKEFKIPYTTYKNPTIRTTCYKTHKGNLNNCHNIVLGHLKCIKTNIMAIITFVTFSHSNNHYACHKLDNYLTLNNINHFINCIPSTHNEEFRLHQI